MKTIRIAGIVVLLLAIWYLSPLYYITLYPVSSAGGGGYIDIAGEPIQEDTDTEPFYFTDRTGRQVKIIPVATYDMSARVAVSRNYPNYFDTSEVEDILTNDMALVWGKFADKTIMKKIKFSHQWTYSGFTYRDEELSKEPGLPYLSQHFSSNHTVAANKNIDHALRRVKKYDRIRMKGYLINLEVPGLPPINTSLVRTDNWTPGQGNTGGSEFIYVTEFQIENSTYR